MDILFFIKAIYKKLWIIAICTVLATVAAFMFTRNDKKIYKSTAQIATGFTLNDMISLNNRPSDMYNSELKFSNVIETITSAQVLNLLSCSLILHDINTHDARFRDISQKDLEKIGLTAQDLGKAKEIFSDKLRKMKMLSSFSPEEKKLLMMLDLFGYDQKTLSEQIKVYRLDRTDFINIDCYSENPLQSAFMANEVCKLFNRFYAAFLSQRSQTNIQILDTLKAKKLQVLEQKQADLKNALDGNDADFLQNSSSLISQYQSQIVGKRSELTAAKLALESVNKSLSDLEINKKSYNENNNDIIRLNSEISSLTTQYINGGSKDEGLADKINKLKSELQIKYNEASRSSGKRLSESELLQKKSEYEIQVASATADIRDLQSNIAKLSGSVKSSASKDIVIQALQKEVDRASADFENASDKYNMALNDLSQSNEFRQILLAQPSLMPERSKRFFTIVLAGVFAGGMTVIIIVLFLYFDLSIKNPSAFQRPTGINILSSTNWVDLKTQDVMNVVTAPSLKDKKSKRNRKNIFREHVRKIRQSLDQSSRKVILFTSTEHGQGKTTLIQALAYSMSLSKKKVLLIDTNFCNNDLTVEMKAKPTLESFAFEGKLGEAHFSEIITKTPIAGIDIVGCEGGDYTPEEVLQNGNLLEHLDELKERYDYILLESAPMNSYTDTRELIKYVDGIVSVFSAEAVIKPSDSEALKYLKSLNGKFQGAILNKVEIEHLDA